MDGSLEFSKSIWQRAHEASVEEKQVAEHIMANQNRSILLEPGLDSVCQLLGSDDWRLDHLHQRMEGICFKFFQTSTNKCLCNPPKPNMLLDSFPFGLQPCFEDKLLGLLVPQFDLNER